MIKTVNGNQTRYTLNVAVGLVQVLVETTSSQSTVYLYPSTSLGAGGHDLLAEEGTAWAWHLGDGLGSVRQLADGAGDVALAQGYTPFGLLLWSEGSAASAYGFTGEQEDPSAGLVFLRARYYDPATGRFLSKDPHPGSIYRPQTLNPYLYVLNNPVNDRDPSGEQGEDALDQFLAVANDFLMGIVYQFVDNNYTALTPFIAEPARSLIRDALNDVAARKRWSIAFQSGRLTGSLISIGQAILEVEIGVPLMGCGSIGAGATSWTGVGVAVGGGVVVVGAAVTAHGVAVGVIGAANAGMIAGDIYLMATEGSGGGVTNRPGYSGPLEGYTNQKPDDLDVAFGERSKKTLQDLLASKDYETPSSLIGADPSLKDTSKYIYVIDRDGVIWVARAEGVHHPDLVGG